MSIKYFQINTLEMEYWQHVLKSIGDEAFPNAVRNTLNNMAFSMRGSNGFVEKRANQLFEYRRNKSFIRSLTWVEKATGTDVDKMSSVGGIFTKPGRDEVAERMPSQETGSPLKHAFTPLRGARSGGRESGRILPRYKLEKISPYIDVSSLSPGDRLRSMIVAAKLGQAIKIKAKNKKHLYVAMPSKNLERIRKKNGKLGKTTRVKLKFLYRQNPGNIANLKKQRPFVQTAGEDAFALLPKIWGKELDKSINKLSKKKR